VFLVLIAVLIYYSYLVKQRVNKELGLLNSKLNEANATKAKLLSIISHDLRGPISSLFGFVQLKRRGKNRLSKEQLEEHDKYISSSAENLLEAMEDLLIWSKSQMDSFNPIIEDVNLSEFFDEVVHLNSTAAKTKNILLIKDCLPHLRLLTDPNFLRIILRNLLSNAMKFTPENGIIYLKAFRQNDTFIITVKDSGLGMAANDLSAILEWGNLRSGSSGLGLKLAKEFTEKLHGSIQVQSQVNKGTEFILSFSTN
jgi:signal transduction histidine kinase